MDAPASCPNCGHALPSGADRCPDCGFPLAPAPERKRGRRASVAAFLLAILFGLSLFQVFTLVVDADAPAAQPLQVEGTTFEVVGTVRDEAGAALANVTVHVSGRPATNTTTAADGTYRLPGVPAGYVELEFDHASSPGTTVRAFVLRSERIDATLSTSERTTSNDASIQRLAWVSQVCGGILLVGSVLTLLGAIACYRRRRWGLALTGAIASLFALLPLSLLLGGLSIAVVATSRSEFRR